jgi:hypothetical protein
MNYFKPQTWSALDDISQLALAPNAKQTTALANPFLKTILVSALFMVISEDRFAQATDSICDMVSKECVVLLFLAKLEYQLQTYSYNKKIDVVVCLNFFKGQVSSITDYEQECFSGRKIIIISDRRKRR